MPSTPLRSRRTHAKSTLLLLFFLKPHSSQHLALTSSQLTRAPQSRTLSTHIFLGAAPNKSSIARQAARVSSCEASGDLDRVVEPRVLKLFTHRITKVMIYDHAFNTVKLQLHEANLWLNMPTDVEKPAGYRGCRLNSR